MLKELVWLRCVLGHWCNGCVRESASKPAILTQASQTRLGEICKDANPLSARGHRSGGGFWGLGEGSSRLGENSCSIVWFD